MENITAKPAEPPTVVSGRVKEYWEEASCGTTVTAAPKYSREYFEEIEEFRYEHEPFIHSFAQFTRWHGKKVVEIGIGAGSDFVQWVRGGAQATGVDLTEEAVRNVQHRLDVFGLPPAHIQTVNAEALPFPDGTFDLAYSWGVIHHAANMEKVFAEIYRVTRPGGHVKLMVYNRNSTHAWYMFFRYGLPRMKLVDGRKWAIYHHQESYATKAYTERELVALVSQFPHRDLRFQYWEQHIRKGSKFEGLRRVIEHVRPARMRWYLCFEFTKPERA